MGWIGCFPRGDSLQGLYRGTGKAAHGYHNRISATSAFYAQSLLRNAAGPYIWVTSENRGGRRLRLYPRKQTSPSRLGMPMPTADISLSVRKRDGGIAMCRSHHPTRRDQSWALHQRHMARTQIAPKNARRDNRPKELRPRASVNVRVVIVTVQAKIAARYPARPCRAGRPERIELH
jgi:hypothetical protein